MATTMYRLRARLPIDMKAPMGAPGTAAELDLEVPLEPGALVAVAATAAAELALARAALHWPSELAET
jgi:hypothetical protein